MKLIKTLKINAICCIFLILLLPVTLIAQDKNLPLDPNLRIGKLANGMTYYIRKNIKPEKRVELRLAVNAGSVQEDDNQLGLAHFVEHMCFNGTKNFPKNDLIHYLQSVGVSFGADVNAYTSFDETVYMITVPTDTEKILNNGIQIMEDWSHDVTFDTSEIDKERGVITEEWRLGRGAWQRMADKFLPVLFKDSKYAKRLPIGTKESIQGSKYDLIKRFYKEWYRPDLMAFIVVGDIDPDKMEQKIKTDFSKFKAPVNERKKELYPIPDNEKTLISNVSDKETPFNSIYILYKTNTETYKTTSDYRRLLTYHLFTGMVNERLNELKQLSNPPFISAETNYGSLWARTKNAYQIEINVGENGIENGLQAVLIENERAKLYGFTKSEFDRYKKMMLKDLEQKYNERDKTESEEFASEYISNYLSGDPIPGIAFEYNYAKENLANIDLDEVNKLAKVWVSDRNRVIIIQGIDKKELKLPSEADIQNVLLQVSKTKVEPYKESILATSLIDKKPQPGKIISTKSIDSLGITEMSLSNGIKVILKPSNFKNDEILMSAYRPGGQSVFPDDYFMSARVADECIMEGGIGNFSKNDLAKMLAGRKVQVAPQIQTYFDGFTGSSSASDLETMMQLIYLYSTQPRKDTSAFSSYLNRQRAFYKNIVSDPVNYFFDKAYRIKYSNHPRLEVLPTDADWDKVNYNKVLEVYQSRFLNMSGFEFIFVGSFTIESIKPMIETYLGSLLSNNTVENWKDLGIRPAQGPVDQKVFKGTDPKSFVDIYMDVPAKWTMEDAHIFYSLGKTLERIYIDKLREEMSGVYGLSVRALIEKVPYQHYKMEIVIPCAPDNVDKLTNAALAEINRIKEKGLTPGELEKEKESQIRSDEKDAKDNNAWLWKLEMIYKTGEDFTRLSNPALLTNKVTSESIQGIAKYLNTDKCIKITLYPEKSK